MSATDDLSHSRELHGLSLPLEVIPSPSLPIASAPKMALSAEDKVYSPERQRDRVRLVVAIGLLAILGYLVIFATVEAASYPTHWTQTKEMLQILLPAVTGIIGTVIGFYFGSAAISRGGPPDA